MTRKICSLCTFYDNSHGNEGEHDKSDGFCRFNAPKIVEDKNSSFWPSVKSTDWCGKFSEIK